MKNSIYNYETHWNKAYKNNPNEKLGWFESDPVTSLELIEKCELEKFISGFLKSILSLYNSFFNKIILSVLSME